MEEAIEAFKRLTQKAEALKKSMTIIPNRKCYSRQPSRARAANGGNHRERASRDTDGKWLVPLNPPVLRKQPVPSPLMASVSAPLYIKPKDQRSLKVKIKHARRHRWFIRFINSL